MLRSLGLAIPTEVSAVCEGFIARCPHRELARMHQSARDLAAMVRPAPAESDSRTPVDKYDYLHSIARTRTNAHWDTTRDAGGEFGD